MFRNALILFLLLVFSLPAYAGWVDITSGTTQPLARASFYNNDTGFVVGYGSTILKTTDGGRTWIRLASAPVEDFWAVKAVSENQIFVSSVSSKNFYKFDTSNNNVQIISSAAFPVAILGMYLKDSNNLSAVGLFSHINTYNYFTTANGGTSWNYSTIEAPGGATFETASVYFVGNDGWIGGRYSYSGIMLSLIAKTEDGGATWRMEKCVSS